MNYGYCLLAGTKKGGCSRKEAILVSEQWWGFNCDTTMGKVVTHKWYIISNNDFTHSLDTYYLHVSLNSAIMNQTYL